MVCLSATPVTSLTTRMRTGFRYWAANGPYKKVSSERARKDHVHAGLDVPVNRKKKGGADHTNAGRGVENKAQGKKGSDTSKPSTPENKVIPAEDGVDHVLVCLDSLASMLTYPNRNPSTSLGFVSPPSGPLHKGLILCKPDLDYRLMLLRAPDPGVPRGGHVAPFPRINSRRYSKLRPSSGLWVQWALRGGFSEGPLRVSEEGFPRVL